MRTIKLKLHSHIRELGITQDEFARLAGMRPATVSLLVNNRYKRIDLSYLLTLLDALETDDFNSILEITDD